MFLENASKKGWIEVVCGSMFSGKTEELIISYLLQRVMFIPASSEPRVTRPTAMRPTYGEYSNDEISI